MYMHELLHSFADCLHRNDGPCHVIAGMSPLNMACNRKNSEVAKLFIQSGSNVNLADDKGNLPLHYVARNGDADVALSLLDAGQCELSSNRTLTGNRLRYFSRVRVALIRH
jgi:ankyrin repeat protein